MRAYVYKVSLLQQFGFAFLLLVLGAYAGLSVNPHQWWATTLIRLALSVSCFVLAVLAFINGLRMVLGWCRAVFGWR